MTDNNLIRSSPFVERPKDEKSSPMIMSPWKNKENNFSPSLKSKGSPLVTRPSKAREEEIERQQKEISSLNYKLSNLQNEKDVEKIRYEKIVLELEKKVQAEGKRSDILESDQSFLFSKHRDTTDQLTALKDQLSKQRVANEQLVTKLRTESSLLKEELIDAKDQIRSFQARQGQGQTQTEIKLKSCEVTILQLQEELTNRDITINSKQNKNMELENEVEKLRADNIHLKGELDQSKSNEAVSKELADQVQYIKELETTIHKQKDTITKYREEHESLGVLKEENLQLEQKLKGMSDLKDKLADMELKVLKYEEERTKWSVFLGPESTDKDEEMVDKENSIPKKRQQFSSPEEVFHALNEERNEKLQYLEKLGRLEAEASSTLQNLENLENELSSSVATNEELQTKLEKETTLRQRIERQKSLASKEAGFLREQLKNYDNEEVTMQQGNYDAQKTLRIQELEKIMDIYKSELSNMTIELNKKDGIDYITSSPSAFSKKRRRTGSDFSLDNQNLSNLIRQNRTLNEVKGDLTKKLRILETDYNSLKEKMQTLEKAKETKKRILQLRDNPLSQDQFIKKQLLDSLRTENIDLLATLENKFTESEKIEKLVPKSVLERLRLEVKEMENTVKIKEKRMLRLRQIFSAKSLEFREAVYSLLGFKLDFLPSNKVKVTSKFSSSDDDSFIFDPEAKTMKMCGGEVNNSFNEECANLITFWVKERREIPCFLSALNLELYERTSKAASF